MKNPFKLIYKAIQSSILCIRFPFLYPRNRFTGLHYNKKDCDEQDVISAGFKWWPTWNFYEK